MFDRNELYLLTNALYSHKTMLKKDSYENVMDIIFNPKFNEEDEKREKLRISIVENTIDNLIEKIDALKVPFEGEMT